jgi:hypothetical protein
VEKSSLPDTSHYWTTAHTTLNVLKPDGSKAVLVDHGPLTAVLDPSPSLDGKWIYYALQHNVTDEGGPGGNREVAQPHGHRPASGVDVYRYNVATQEIQRLTHQEKAPFAGRPAGHSVYNMGPCEVAGGRVLFTSDREVPGRHQLWAMDVDGKNVEKVGYLNLSSALTPERLSDGRIMWSSREDQGTRDISSWGLWHSYPDGRDFEPLLSSYLPVFAIHFHTEAAGGQIVATEYYPNDTFGQMRAAPYDAGFGPNKQPANNWWN